jgi:hypothetical protein
MSQKPGEQPAPPKPIISDEEKQIVAKWVRDSQDICAQTTDAINKTIKYREDGKPIINTSDLLTLERGQEKKLNAIFTDPVNIILAKELAALAPQVEADTDLAKKISHKGRHIEAQDLVNTLTKNNVRLFQLDENKDGEITLDELSKSLKSLPDARVPVSNTHQPPAKK